jgi:hypothetical protein
MLPPSKKTGLIASKISKNQLIRIIIQWLRHEEGTYVYKKQQKREDHWNQSNVNIEEQRLRSRIFENTPSLRRFRLAGGSAYDFRFYR